MACVESKRVECKSPNADGREQAMRTSVNPDALRRAVERSTRSSAALERRAVPAGHVRSGKAARFLAARRSE